VVVDQGAAAETEWSHATSANLMSLRAAAMKPPPAAVAQGGPPPGTIPVTAIGDSVMLGAAGALQGRLGATGHIDALVSRQFSAGIAVAHELRAEQRLGRVVIVHLGTNGPIHDRDVDAMMAELGQADAVLFVSIRVDRPWQAVVNQTLASAAHRYPRAHLVDWYGYSAGHPEWLYSDGTHLDRDGAGAYAALIGASIPNGPPTPPPPTSPPPSLTPSPPPPTATPTPTPAAPAPAPQAPSSNSPNPSPEPHPAP
jgi:lysophospholipase L1-like esterase